MSARGDVQAPAAPGCRARSAALTQTLAALYFLCSLFVLYRMPAAIVSGHFPEVTVKINAFNVLREG